MGDGRNKPTRSRDGARGAPSAPATSRPVRTSMPRRRVPCPPLVWPFGVHAAAGGLFYAAGLDARECFLENLEVTLMLYLANG